MSQSKTTFDLTKIKETVRLKCSKATSKKILPAGLLGGVFLTGLIVFLVFVVGNKSPGKEGKQPLNISLCVSYKISAAFILIYKPIYERRVEKNKMLRSASSTYINAQRVSSTLY